MRLNDNNIGLIQEIKITGLLGLQSEVMNDEFGELSKLKIFVKEHDRCRADFIGGKFCFKFYPSNIGTTIFISCDVCKVEKDLTEDVPW